MFSVPVNTVQVLMGLLDGIDRIYATKIDDNFLISIPNIKGIVIIKVTLIQI